MLGRLGTIVYAPTDVGPLWYSRLVSVPDIAFRRLPRLTQDRIAMRCIRPACSHFVRVRLAGLRITTGVQLAAASERDGALRIELSDGGQREVDHLMFATGYRVDVARYPFMTPELIGAIRRHNGYPILGRGLESSVPGLHFSGAPAAWSYGPIMRFVSGSWYAARTLSPGDRRRPTPGARHGDRRRLTRGGSDWWSGLLSSAATIRGSDRAQPRTPRLPRAGGRRRAFDQPPLPLRHRSRARTGPARRAGHRRGAAGAGRAPRARRLGAVPDPGGDGRGAVAQPRAPARALSRSDPSWEVVRWVWDKRNTYELAAELGIPTPRTWTLRGGDTDELVDGDGPFAVKPAIKEHFLYETGLKAWRADTREQLRERVRAASELLGAEEVIVQELIPGSGETQLAYCAFFRDGGPAASMVVRRLRQHPPLFGRASTFVETIEEPELEELSERFLRHIGYYGLVEVEYKRDPRDGLTKLLDVNARTWGYHSLGQRAGVDFPHLLFADQLSQPAPSGLRARTGVSWIRLATDVPTALMGLARGTLGWRSYLRSLRAADVESVFTRDDLRPGLAELALIPYLAVKRGF